MSSYSISGMNCAACSAHIERAVGKVPGVNFCEVSLVTNSMELRGIYRETDVIEAVERLGYGIVRVDDTGYDEYGRKTLLESLDPPLRPALIRFTLSLVLTALLFYVATEHVAFGLPLPFLPDNPAILAGAELLLATLVFIINGGLIAKGIRGLLTLSPGMDTLVAIGTLASYLYSLPEVYKICAVTAVGFDKLAVSLLRNLYFESASMLLVFITFGKILERLARGRTTSALKSLIAITPKYAHMIVKMPPKDEKADPGTEKDGAADAETAKTEAPKETKPEIEDAKDIPGLPPGEWGIQQTRADNLYPGDYFVVRTGETIPADAEVAGGAGAVNEACLTGESIPRDVGEGDAVSGACVLVSGLLLCRATRTGSATTFSQIILTVKKVLAGKAPIARISDRISLVFVPAVIAIAVVTFLFWRFMLGNPTPEALTFAVSVLLVSCPCALGLATPVAITTGSGKALMHRLLFKTAAALENAGKVKNMVLDKTGTVTAGEPAVAGVKALAGAGPEELAILAAYLEKNSNHPIARAVAAHCRADPATLGDKAREIAAKLYPRAPEEEKPAGFSEKEGRGVEAVINGRAFYMGKPAFVVESAGLSADVAALCEETARKGGTVLLLASEKEALGIFSVRDTVREYGAEAVALLYRDGIRPFMLTGDNVYSAADAAEAVNIADFRAGMLPGDKARAIAAIKAGGATAMVGDGINDALPLAEADVGIAMGAGSDIAKETGEVVLVQNDLLSLVRAVRLSRAVIRVIKQNLFWALCYNIVGIPMAAGLFLPWGLRLTPMFSAVCMCCSSLLVVGNSLRLYLVNVSSERLLREGRAELAKIRRDKDGYLRKFDARHPFAGWDVPVENAAPASAPAAEETKEPAEGAEDAGGASAETKKEEPAPGAADTAKEPAPDGAAGEAKTARLVISGMSCEHCEKLVSKIVGSFPGVLGASASHASGSCEVKYRGELDLGAIKKALAAEDYRLEDSGGNSSPAPAPVPPAGSGKELPPGSPTAN